MKKQKPAVSFLEFTDAWVKCVRAIDTLIMEKGYDALTAENICKRSGLTEDVINAYFGSLDTLLQMHDGLILWLEVFKTRMGNQQPE